jgi:hypothetical protein
VIDDPSWRRPSRCAGGDRPGAGELAPATLARLRRTLPAVRLQIAGIAGAVPAAIEDIARRLARLPFTLIELNPVIVNAGGAIAVDALAFEEDP